ncbi:hypothetical protein [Noviluteimonas gilva]|uniref:Transmembrane protein n=1 Tax=Noviluteimonas gilva TaxID=2682097 RepID=A0A7C9HNN7_9GAMM|nr:hypothetical protein [Lysobacter gilvus]MUV15495.1 hypothetical protein [Lysobacter gilvus]
MRNFHAWQRRTMRRADRQLWGGLLLIVIAAVVAVWLPSALDRSGTLAAVFAMLRYLVALPLLAGATFAAMGAWTLWCLHRDPLMLYYRHDGR